MLSMAENIFRMKDFVVILGFMDIVLTQNCGA